jgi:hypothetical protein
MSQYCEVVSVIKPTRQGTLQTIAANQQVNFPDINIPPRGQYTGKKIKQIKKRR